MYTYLKALAGHKGDDIKNTLASTQHATAGACGLSERTVCNICAEAQSSQNDAADEMTEPSFTSPKKKNGHKKPVTNMDDFMKGVIRHTVLGVYDCGEYPTYKKVMEVLKVNCKYMGSVTSLGQILKSLGFKYKKYNDGQRLLME
ncbi:hypothetical protein PR048_005038 [Dryococelus australis]|uniref:Winged helix-turn helix domain-containing protein n=1 Tax=Dryococelus australis TaxID=614101 RepID=A0ABQ9I736_9NEOP|nr:hypothetical protein PR048_005038 [Dryococelus australis]